MDNFIILKFTEASYIMHHFGYPFCILFITDDNADFFCYALQRLTGFFLNILQNPVLSIVIADRLKDAAVYQSNSLFQNDKSC